MTIETIHQDITKTDKDIIIQQVNCLGLMGAGLARTLMERYPNIRKEYIKFREKERKKVESNEELLGLVNYVDVHDGKIIANVFGQVGIRKDRHDDTVYTVKEALLAGIESVKGMAEENGFSIAIPTYIGCGLAGGNWTEIKKGIDGIFKDASVDVSYYEYRK